MATPEIIDTKAAPNPANRVVPTRQRTAGETQLKLEVPEIPGYFCYWFRGTPDRLEYAQSIGFEFVDPGEIRLNNPLVGDHQTKTGNTDLGNRVSVAAGAETVDGQGLRLYLMKQRQEWHEEDLKAMGRRSDEIAEALTSQIQTGQVGGPAPGESQADRAMRYVSKQRTVIPDMFRKKS